MWSVILFLNVLICLISSTESKRILSVYPGPSVSHQVVFRSLTNELVKRRNEVVVITPDPEFPNGKAPVNLTEIDVHDISYKSWKEEFLATTTGKSDIITQTKIALNLFSHILEKQIKTNDVQQIIQKQSDKFDLLLIEACALSAVGLSHVFKVPTIQISSFGTMEGDNEIIGAPIHPLLYPTVMHGRHNTLTTREKLREVYEHLRVKLIHNARESSEEEMLRRNFGQEMPSLKELRENVQMLFLNVHSMWSNNQPVPPALVTTGGMHLKPVKELPQDLLSYLDSSVNGVIYMSFGTNTIPSSLPPEKIQVFVSVFSKLPYDILWKWDKDVLPGQSKNIRIAKWFPQSDLLQHPKIKLFITQGGMQSTHEAIRSGVPLIGIPISSDQWYNVEKYVYYNIGLRLDLESITEDNFKNGIETVIANKSFRRNMSWLRSVIQDQPQPPLERAAWWTEYVLRHGGARHLRSPAANMSWSEYLELELVLAFLTLFLLLTSTIIWLVRICLNSLLCLVSGVNK